MENLQISNSNKYLEAANAIEGLLLGINYEVFSRKTLESIIFLINYIRVIPAEEISNFRIKKFTESWVIFKKLESAYSERRVQEVMRELLIEYEHYEILKEIEF